MLDTLKAIRPSLRSSIVSLLHRFRSMVYFQLHHLLIDRLSTGICNAGCTGAVDVSPGGMLSPTTHICPDDGHDMYPPVAEEFVTRGERCRARTDM